MENSVARFANKYEQNTVTQKVTVTDGKIEVKATLADGYSGAVYLNGLTIKQIVEEKDTTETKANVQNVYSYTDKNLEQNKEYTYKVAAVVDGKPSFKSKAVTLKTLLNIREVLPLEDLTIVADTPDYEALIPDTVTVIDANGNKVDGIEVKWDMTSFDITKTGEYILTGTIEGYDKEVTLKITVEANTVTGYEALDDVYVVAGTKAVLPTTVKHNMKNGTVKELPVTWNTESLDTDTTGEYVITGTTELLDNVTVKVIVKDNYIVSVASAKSVEVNKGEIAKLPDTLTATYADGQVKEVEVIWDDVDTSKIGTYVVNGTVKDYAQKVTVTVYVVKAAYKKFDFGISTSKVAEGWTGVTVNKKGGTAYGDYVYSKEQGYGFTDIGKDTLSSPIQGCTEEFTYTGEGTLPYDVYTDFVLPANTEFKVDLPNGNYSVQVIANSIYASKVQVSIEGGNNVTVSNAAGSYTIYTEESVEITDGQLNLAFPSGTWRLGGIIITKNDSEEESTEETTEVTTEETTEVTTEVTTEETTEETTEDDKHDNIVNTIVKVIVKVVKKIVGFIKGFGRH